MSNIPQLIACVDCGASFPRAKRGPCPTRCKPCRSRHAWAGRKQFKQKCESCGKPCRGRRCRGCYQPHNKGTCKRAPLTCIWCKQPFAFSVNSTTRKPKVHCSPACRQAAVAARARKTCETCGAAFMKNGGSGLGRYCSVACYWSARRGQPWTARDLGCSNTSHRGRCLWYGVPYDPQVKSAAVFERDGYVCQLCGCATLRRYTRNLFGHVDRKSPTVDHIEPLHWRGKGHTWDNVRLLCVHCNCVERNRKGHAKTVKSRKARRTTAR